MRQNETIRACIVGVSGYGSVHYDQLLMPAQRAGTVEVVGATIINPQEEAQKCAELRALGCRIFDDYREMMDALSGAADLCLVPTGIPFHCPMTVAALEAGMHVLVEKPLAGCVEDARAMQAAAEKADRIVAVGYQHMYTPAAQATKQHILNGAIGGIESIKCLVMWPRTHEYYSRNHWAGRLTVDGMQVNDSPFNNAVAHEVTMMLFQAGREQRTGAVPTAVSAELYRANDIESTDTACLHIETAQGLPLRFYVTHACREEFGPEIHIRGTRGTITMTHQGVVIEPDEGEPIRYVTDSDSGTRATMMDAVLDRIQGGSAFICDLETASRQTMVVSGVHATAAIQPVAGETVSIETGASLTLIPGVDAALRRAFSEECTLGECGQPWAKATVNRTEVGSAISR